MSRKKNQRSDSNVTNSIAIKANNPINQSDSKKIQETGSKLGLNQFDKYTIVV